MSQKYAYMRDALNKIGNDPVAALEGNGKMFIDETMKIIKDYETKKYIDPLVNMKDKPYYIYAGSADKTVPTMMAYTLEDIYKKLGAKPKIDIGEGMGHKYQPETPWKLMDYLVKTISGAEGLAKPASADWKTKGIIDKFSTTDLLKETGKEFYGKDGGDIGINMHNILNLGIAYYPKTCIAKDRKTKCKFMLVLHGTDSTMEVFLENFAPMAADNDVILVIPMVVSAWDNRYPPYMGAKAF